MHFRTLLCLFGLIFPAAAQLSVDQKAFDFQNLAALYAKRYAPYEWKRDTLGFDMMKIEPWLQRVRASRDDLDFFELCAEYVASLQDTHTSFRMPGSLVADLGFTVDIYDGRVLVEQVNRLRLPMDRYPIDRGDELVSVDGRSAEQLIAQFSRYRTHGNPRSTRRIAADQIVFRTQVFNPRAAELGETAQVVIRHRSGETGSYVMTWAKSGNPATRIGPVPMPRASKPPAIRGLTLETFDFLEPFQEMWNWSVDPGEPLLQGTTWSEELEQEMPRRYVLGYGARAPVFQMPENFRMRLGITPRDFHFSGAFEAEGLRIGYLRFPNFAPPTPALGQPSAVNELENEIRYFQQNTDGLVVDVMRNTGGGCYMLDAARRLIPYTFYFFGEEIRPTLDRINSLTALRQLAERANADQWVIQLYDAYLSQLNSAYREYRGRTGSIPACSSPMPGRPFNPASFENEPAAVVYTKPLIVLVDEFSTSAGDIFPAMLQDNGRGPLVGTRTNGAGGSVSAWPAGFYAEMIASNTNTLVTRKEFRTIPGYPASRYIENVGAHADIQLDAMTAENLLTTGRPFVQGFTRAIVNHIRGQQQ